MVQELVAAGFQSLHIWHGRTSEVEFLIESDGRTTPVDVKSGTVTNAQSLVVYVQIFTPAQAVIFSGKNVCRRSETVKELTTGHRPMCGGYRKHLCSSATKVRFLLLSIFSQLSQSNGVADAYRGKARELFWRSKDEEQPTKI